VLPLACLALLTGCHRPEPTAPSAPVTSVPLSEPATALSDIARRRPAPPGHGDVDRAETRAQKTPDDPAARRDLGLSYYAAGAYPLAAAQLEKAVAAAPGDGLAWAYLGYARLGLGDQAKAIEALGRAEQAPGTPPQVRGEVLVTRGNLRYQALNDDAVARADFMRAVAIAVPAVRSEARLALGTMAAASGKTADAQRLFELAAAELAAGPPRAAAYACLGRLAESAKRDTDARAYYAKALKDDPDNAWARAAQTRGGTKR
jgi:tetratricopeptide (TPR) repeat protein